MIEDLLVEEVKARYLGVGLPLGGQPEAAKQKGFLRERGAIIKAQRPKGGRPPVQRFAPFPKAAVRPKPPKVGKREVVE